MLRRFLIAALLAGAGLPALCQDAPIRPLPQVPYWLIYREFLFRVTWLDALADRFAAQGKDDSGPRTLIRRQAGLTPAEEAALKSIAKAWRTQNDSILAAARSLVAAGQHTAQSPQLQDLQNQRQQAVLDSNAQLQTVLGPATFKLLDVYVRRTSTVRTGAQKAAP